MVPQPRIQIPSEEMKQVTLFLREWESKDRGTVINCSHCRAQTALPHHSIWPLELIDTGDHLESFNVDTLAVVHSCGNSFYFECELCGYTQNAMEYRADPLNKFIRRMTRTTFPVPQCKLCNTPMRSFKVSV